jgi:hypothetical protein
MRVNSGSSKSCNCPVPVCDWSLELPALHSSLPPPHPTPLPQSTCSSWPVHLSLPTTSSPRLPGPSKLCRSLASRPARLGDPCANSRSPFGLCVHFCSFPHVLCVTVSHGSPLVAPLPSTLTLCMQESPQRSCVPSIWVSIQPCPPHATVTSTAILPRAAG